MKHEKKKVFEFWNNASCGEEMYLRGNNKEDYQAHSEFRYSLEPYIYDFANFNSYYDKKVLEIGIGLGADHQYFAEAGAELYGIDLTERAVIHTKHRLSCFNLKSKIEKSDAENLSFSDESFDLVYSWGVIHHSPNTQKCVDEIWRVLKDGGSAKVMIYHKWSMVGFMLWLRYAILNLKPWRSLNYIYANYLESPGTKTYTTKEAEKMFSKFNIVQVKTVLSHSDLISSDSGQRHRGILLNIAKKIWPRELIKFLLPWAGLYMLIKVQK